MAIRFTALPLSRRLLVEVEVFSPDGKTLATGGWDQTVLLSDAATGRIKTRWRGQNQPKR